MSPARSAQPRAARRESRGSLRDSPLPELLMRLRRAGATGLLFLQDLEERVVRIEGGAPVAVASNRSEESFADFLMRTKRISDLEHEALLERVESSGESEDDAVVAVGAMSPREVNAARLDHGAEPLLEAFLWTDGSWRFERGARLDAGQPIAAGVAAVLAKGVMQWAPERCIRAMLQRRRARYLARSRRPPHALAELSPPPCDADLLRSWTGASTVGEVLASREIGARELCTLLVVGLVETLNAPAAPGPARRAAAPVAEVDGEEDAPLELEDLCEPIEPAASRPPRRPPAPPSSPARRSTAPPRSTPARRSTAPARSRPAARVRRGLLARIRRWLGV